MTVAYTTVVKMRTRYGDEIDQLMDRNNDGTTDDSIGLQAISDAEAIINGRLATRYTTPVDPVPESLHLIASDIARFFLWDDAVPETVEKRYDNAMQYLRDIATGKADLAVEGRGESESASSGTGAIFARGREPINIDGYAYGR